eukprot:Nitzschia sp. Nitz4//scaffold77_size91520//988//3402//NITZ4_004875-RA/size91520-processed-gene-0.19-mRNA-1//1//CDS//3329557946//2517//frame0
MVKARVGARLKVAVGGAKNRAQASQTGNEDELTQLTKSYKEFTKQLEVLIKALKAHYKAQQVVSSSSVNVIHEVAKLAEGTPFFEAVGQPREGGNAASEEEADDLDQSLRQDRGDNATLEADETTDIPTNSANNRSYLAIHLSFASKTRRQRQNVYAKNVLDYVVNWERIITARISADLKKAEQLRVELVHYQGKVETLRQSVENIMNKGKTPKDELKEKLDRNTEKLAQTRDAHETFVTDLSILMDEVVNRNHRDLQPLLVEMLQYDIKFSIEQARSFKDMREVLTDIKQTGTDYGIQGSRLDDLQEKTPRELDTRDLVVRGGDYAPRSRAPASSPVGGAPAAATKQNKKAKATPSNAAAASAPMETSQEVQMAQVKVIESEEPHFYVACATGDVDWLRHFVRFNKDSLDEPDDEGLLPLGIAARCGHVECVQILLENGAQVNLQDHIGCSPLHHAAEKGHVGCGELLLERGAQINAVDGEGFTSLHLAVERNNVEVVALLLRYKAEMDKSNSEYWRPIHVAASNGSTGSLKLLLENGASVSKLKNEKWTALHLAAANGHESCVKTLLEFGAEVEETDRSGSTPLQKATEKSHLDCMRLLMEFKANPNTLDNEGYTPLIAASLEGRADCMRLLLERKADVNMTHPDGWAPVHLVADNGHDECMAVLVEFGADLHVRNQDGWTALHKAAEQGHTRCARILLDNGADIECENNDGFTPLIVAAFNGHHEIAAFLLDRNASIDKQDTNGCGPLYWAAAEGHYDCTNLFLERWADATLADRDGKTPMDVARSNGHVRCETLLSMRDT